MNASTVIKCLFSSAVSVLVLAGGQSARAQTLVLQLKAANYNPTTGTWTDSSGNGNSAQASGAFPTVAASASPNGSPAVVFSGGNPVSLANAIPAGSGYTAVAYIKPATGAGPYALFGGAPGSFEYRIYNSKQDALRQQQADLGSESTALSTTSFSVVDCTVSNAGGGTFRVNGANDGNNAATTFTSSIGAIGARASSGGENFSGSVCEIDIYTGVLTASQITNAEEALTAAYVTPLPTGPVVTVDTTASPATATVGGSDTLTAAFTGALPISYQWFVSPNPDGSGATSIAEATNTTLVLTNLQASASGLYYSLRATNNVAPYSTNTSWLQLEVVPLAPMVQLIATNYDGISVWTDTSGNGNNATYSGSVAPTLTPFVTPNGGSAVNISSGGGSFVFASSLAQSTATGSGYTVFAYVEPSNLSGRQALTGGSSSGALEYDIYAGHQDYLREYLQDVANGADAIPTSSFSLIDVAVNSSGAAFRLDGSPDGSAVAGAAFSSPITRIGNNEGGGDGFVGSIAEIDIYSGALTTLQISNIEAGITARYVTANSVVVGPATVSPTNNTYAGNSITLSASVIGGTGTTAYAWQTDNGSGGSSFTDINGANSTNYALNTASLLGTYEYRLVATPFGGTSVTSAPVALTVQAATAPVIVTDTTASPNSGTVSGNVTLSASFAGNLPISYQWQVSANASGSGAVNIPGATNSTLTLSNLQLNASGQYYSLQASNDVAPYVVNSTWLQLNIGPLTPLVQLIATNYSAGSATWSDSSGNGNDATYFGSSTPTLVPFVTPNGGSAVDIVSGNNQFFFLSSALDPSSGYTVVAYVEPFSLANRQALTGGSSSGALEYDIYNGKQDYLREYVQDVGSGADSLPTNSFSLVDLAVDYSGAAFRLNGAPDGSILAGATFSSPITRIANNEGGGDGFTGLIAEIDIYNGVLSPAQINNIEAQFTSKYVAANSIVIGPATVSPTNVTYAGNSVTLAARIIGEAGNTMFQWQTDNGSGGASFANISGATNTNYVLNTTTLLGTYEYQLVGTPFGGTSVTGAPVTLTVQAASAPVVVTDTTATPNPGTVAGNVTLSASFTGNLPISYQWQVSPNSSGSGAVNIPGATNATLTLSNLQLSASGQYYSLRASNSIAPYIANSSWLQLNVTPVAALVQLVATNYDATTGMWTDSSGNNNNATYFGSANPTLDTLVTATGGSAVNISTGGGSFVLTSALDPSSGYTVVAYVSPASTSGRNALTGGSSPGALEYDIYNGNQDYLQEYQADVGKGNAIIPVSGFSLIDVSVNSSGATFRFDGAPDGTAAGAAFSSPITRIGNNEGGGDSFVGDIAEIDIYNGALTSNQVAGIEAQLTTEYGSVGVSTTPVDITAIRVGNSLQLSWPADHIGWTLESQTNALAANWVRVAGSSTTDQVTVPITTTNSGVFYRLVYP